MHLMREDEWEPLSPPTPEKKRAAKGASLDTEARKRIALDPGKVADLVRDYGYSESFIMTCRREFKAEREAAGLAKGPIKAYPPHLRRNIALTQGTLKAIAKEFGISTSTLCSYRNEFYAERMAAGLEHEETHPQATQAGQSEKTSGNRRASQRAAAGHAADEKAAEGRPEEKPANPERLGSRVMRAIQDWLL